MSTSVHSFVSGAALAAIGTGDSLFVDEDFDGAHGAYTTALDAAGCGAGPGEAGRPDVLLKRSAALIKLRRFEEALDDASAAATAAPASVLAMYRQGCVWRVRVCDPVCDATTRVPSLVRAVAAPRCAPACAVYTLVGSVTCCALQCAGSVCACVRTATSYLRPCARCCARIACMGSIVRRSSVYAHARGHARTRAQSCPVSLGGSGVGARLARAGARRVPRHEVCAPSRALACHCAPPHTRVSRSGKLRGDIEQWHSKCLAELECESVACARAAGRG